jgi:uncharacterized protein RhaS with RHS repeats
MYSPNLDRWTTVDPIGYDASDVNLYGYVGNTPANDLDPSGLEGYGRNHCYPLHLGRSKVQPVFSLESSNHTKYHNYFRKNGLAPGKERDPDTGKADPEKENFGAKNYDDARKKWTALKPEEQKIHI